MPHRDALLLPVTAARGLNMQKQTLLTSTATVPETGISVEPDSNQTRCAQGEWVLSFLQEKNPAKPILGYYSVFVGVAVGFTLQLPAARQMCLFMLQKVPVS